MKLHYSLLITVAFITAFSTACQKSETSRTVVAEPIATPDAAALTEKDKQAIADAAAVLAANVEYKNSYTGVMKIRSSGASKQNLIIDSDAGDKVVCASSPGSDVFHIWGLRKSDDFKTSVLIEVGSKAIPQGKVSFSHESVSQRTSFTIVTRPDHYFWSPGQGSACQVHFANDGKTLKGKFDCKNLEEVGHANSGNIRTSFKGTFECAIQEWSK